MEVPVAVWFWVIGVALVVLSWVPPTYPGLLLLGLVSGAVGVALAFKEER